MCERKIALAVVLLSCPALAQWNGFTDQSTALQTNRFDFGGNSNPEAGDTNENYYDGDFGDIDGDGRIDRGVISRYGLLLNTGGGLMTPVARNLNQYRFGDADNVGNDAVQWVDVDGDGDLDSVQGGNGEPLTLQINRRGRFSIKWKKTSDSALNIVSIDLEKDGDADLVVAHAYCGRPDNCGCGLPNCGGPVDFGLYVNDGQGNYTEESAMRGLPPVSAEIVQPVAGDLDGDGDFDLVFGRGDTGQLGVAKNNGTGSFTVTNLNLLPPPGGFTQGSHLADIDNDGDLDVVLGNEFPGADAGTIAHKIYINDGTGMFSDQSSTRFIVGSATNLWGENSEVVDVDYDGDLDFVALRKTAAGKDVQVYLNSGTGVMTYSPTFSMTLPGPGVAFGADLDVGDIDGDGTYDLWVGLPGEKVRPLINSYRRTDGRPADLPQQLRVVSMGTGPVVLAWTAPAFAATNRHYRVYRSTSAELGRSDRTLIKVIARSRHENEGFFAPITRFTTTAQLGDPDVQLNGAMNEIQFTDRTATPGVTYQYWVSHVGPEHAESAHAGPVAAMAGAAPPGADTTAPQLDVVSPTRDEFSVYPRVVLTYADGQSGINPMSLRVTFDRALGGAGGRAANTNVADLFQRKDAQAYVNVFGPPLSLPPSTLVTMTVSVDDMAANRATRTVQFVTGATPAQNPTASMALTPTGGAAPLTMSCVATASTDSDGKIVSWEWAFGDGATLNGRDVSKTWTRGGTFPVTLIVRDNEGGVGIAQQMVTITGAGGGAGGGSGGSGGTGGAGGTGGGSASGGGSAAGGAGGGDTSGGGAGGASGGGTAGESGGGTAGSSGGGTAGAGGASGGGSGGDGGGMEPVQQAGCGCGAAPGLEWVLGLAAIVARRRRARA